MRKITAYFTRVWSIDKDLQTTDANAALEASVKMLERRINPMGLQDDLIEVTKIEVTRRVLEPVDDDIPDPGVDFEACVEAVAKRTKRKVKSLSPGKRHAYFLEYARSSLEWCRRINTPAQFTKDVEQWLERLQRRWPS